MQPDSGIGEPKRVLKATIKNFNGVTIKGERGDTGEKPTNDELLALIKPLIPEVKDGEDYILTSKDKKEIAKAIKVPIVEKIIEKTEVIVEKPIVTNEIKEVAVTDTAEQVRDKLSSLEGEERLDAKHIKNLPKSIVGGASGIKEIVAGTNITVDNTTLGYPVISATGGGGGGAVDSVNGQTGVVVLDTSDIAATTDNNYVTDADLLVLANTSGTNTGDQDTFGGVAVSGQDTVTPASPGDTLVFTAGTNITITTDNITKEIVFNSTGGGGSSTKGIAEVDFGANTTQSDIATVSVADATVTSTSYPSVSMYALATTDHDPDDYMAEGLIPYVTNVQNGVGFDISVRAPNMTFGKYKVTYQF